MLCELYYMDVCCDMQIAGFQLILNYYGMKFSGCN